MNPRRTTLPLTVLLVCVTTALCFTGVAGRSLEFGRAESSGTAQHGKHVLAGSSVPDTAADLWRRITDWAGQGISSWLDGGKRQDFKDVDDRTVRRHWALLVAGSNGWWNYRHQADVAHAYQVLRAGGFLPEHVVVMMYDDLVGDSNNPYPGRLYNRPGGPDVYRGLHIDYRGEHVTADTFLAVLAGNRTGVLGKGSGKVIASGPNDRVFVFYSDHGSPGVLGMPAGNFLYADQLMATIAAKRAAGGFREMVLYIEACESGSMFEGLLGSDLGVYATTASNAMESSWGTYCPGMDVPPSAGFDTCLGDLYSVAWMEDAECEDARLETLQEQYKSIAARTSNNYTYAMGSHVMQYGAVKQQGREHTGSYQGVRDASSCVRPSPSRVQSDALLLGSSVGQRATSLTQLSAATSVLQRDADLVPLRTRVARARSPDARRAAQAALDAALAARQTVDTGLQAATAQLLETSTRGPQRALLGAGPPGRIAARLLREALPAREGRPVVDDWECLRGLVAAYTHVCGPMDQYAMKHTRVLANLCNAGLGCPAAFQSALQQTQGCAALRKQTEVQVV